MSYNHILTSFAGLLNSPPLKLYLYHLWDQDPIDYNVKIHQLILKQITPHGSDKVTSMAQELYDQGLDFDSAIRKMADTKKGLTMMNSKNYLTQNNKMTFLNIALRYVLLNCKKNIGVTMSIGGIIKN